MTELLDKEILDLVIGGMTVREMGAMSFLQWLSKKIDGVAAYRADTQEILMAVSHPPMSSSFPDSEKIRLIRKLIALNIAIP